VKHGDRGGDEVAVAVEVDLAEEAVADACAWKLACQRRARTVRPRDRVEQDLRGVTVAVGAIAR